MNIGTDKWAHLGLGGLIGAVVTIVAMLQEGMTGWGTLYMPFIGHIVVFVVSVLKEMVDGKFDWWDILAAMVGSSMIHIAVFFGALFYTLSL